MVTKTTTIDRDIESEPLIAPNNKLHISDIDSKLKETSNAASIINNPPAHTRNLDRDLPPTPKLSLRARFSSWRFTIASGLTTTICIFILNTSLLCWSYGKIDSVSGDTILYQGSCDYTDKISTWSHLVINVLSAGLLGISNTAMQCLASPSRDDIDRAHAQKKCLDIGVNSLANVTCMSYKRKTIWWLLLISTVPLSLLSVCRF